MYHLIITHEHSHRFIGAPGWEWTASKPASLLKPQFLAPTANIPSSSSSKHSITEEQLVAYVEYLIDNIYVSIGNRVYRQCVGIPMGTDCAPLLGNLFLFYYEYGYMKGLIKTDLVLAKKFNNTMRYIDDTK